MEKVAVVTGTSSGIGFETALALAREGYYTYATMRDTTKSDKIEELGKKDNLKISVLELDVDDEISVKNAIRKILDQKQRIDILVNNAGWGLWGCVEDVSVDEFKAQFDTNFFSIIRLIQEVGPTMRKQGSGKIINISSVAGRIGFPASPAYISSKFALEGLSECLRLEMAPFGVDVVIIEPGVIKTNFLNPVKLAKKSESDTAYNDITSKVVSGIKMMAEMGTPPKEVADAVVKSIKDDKPLPRYIVGNDASMFLEAKKNKTDIEFENYLKKELYGE
uniref:Short-chain dehydrogenase/reductase SDR n=1 Tax=uncultured marine thaumarchaeote AD1000_54_E04 TaxID=1455924 RepID=A0A075FU83_9ARCH|nr:short-chain dehydrogenase/reductase SDR [uncultured marine thaumarchaeote AD1000_54_E04]